MRKTPRGETTDLSVPLTPTERMMLYRIAGALGETLAGSMRALIYEKNAHGTLEPIIIEPATNPKPQRNGMDPKRYPKGHVGNYMSMSLDELLKH